MNRIAALLTIAVGLGACAAPLATGDDPTGIEGMSPADVIRVMEEMGIECSEPEKGLVHIGFSCVETPNVVSVDGTSNTIDEMAGVEIHVGDGNRATAVRLASAVLSIPYQGADPAAALAWLSERLDSEACVLLPDEPGPIGCDQAFGAGSLLVAVDGQEGSIEVRLAGVAPRDCPSLDLTLTELIAIGNREARTCFGNSQLTLRGWVWDDRGVYDCAFYGDAGDPRPPDWLYCAVTHHFRLTPVAYPPGEPSPGFIGPADGPFWVAVDPDSPAAGVVQPNRWVEVVGRFDDPVTEQCELVGDPKFREECLSTFVVNAARVIEAP